MSLSATPSVVTASGIPDGHRDGCGVGGASVADGEGGPLADGFVVAQPAIATPMTRTAATAERAPKRNGTPGRDRVMPVRRPRSPRPTAWPPSARRPAG